MRPRTRNFMSNDGVRVTVRCSTIAFLLALPALPAGGQVDRVGSVGGLATQLPVVPENPPRSWKVPTRCS